MARKKKEKPVVAEAMPDNVVGLRSEVLEQPITETLESNYMPYAMSVIVSRAIPEIDGFKPSHRKLLYTMYKMNLLTGARTKSANIVGQTMRLNPHGEASIYETMVRLSKGYEALLCPFVDSKGNFGKVYSRDMAYAASRYTEAKLSAICKEVFGDIDKDTVDMADNYDGSMKEPVLLPTSFPNILVSPNVGIAVGMASSICSFNITEVCETAIALLRDPDHNVKSTLPAPDFPTGGEVIMDASAIDEVYETGRGAIKLRAKWRYISKLNIIEIYEIPYTTNIEVIMDKLSDMVKNGKLKEISDARDETDLGGFKLTLDLKRGTDPDKLMQKLFRATPLMDSFFCNFNILIEGHPKVMGILEIFDEWTAWREACVKRRTYFDLTKKQEKLHLLLGLEKILLDIDKAIEIIRKTERESDVIPNLMAGFGIDKIQAEYIAEIKLRNINKEYILKRTKELDELRAAIAELTDLLKNRKKIRNVIIKELTEVIKQHGSPRKTEIVYAGEDEAEDEQEEIPDYPVHVFVSREGYLKKITPLSLRMSGEQKYKDGDSLAFSCEGTNRAELLVFSDKQQVYKLKLSEIEETKASLLGTYLPSELEMDEGESVLQVIYITDYSGDLLLFYENGKVARFGAVAYETKNNRRKLMNAYSDKSRLIKVMKLTEEMQFAMISSEERALIINSALLAPKVSRTTQGVNVMSIKAKHRLKGAYLLTETAIKNQARYRARSLPARGAILTEDDRGEKQLSMLD